MFFQRTWLNQIQKRVKAFCLAEHRKGDDLWVLGAVLATSAIAVIECPRQEGNWFLLMVSESMRKCIFLTTWWHLPGVQDRTIYLCDFLIKTCRCKTTGMMPDWPTMILPCIREKTLACLTGKGSLPGQNGPKRYHCSKSRMFSKMWMFWHWRPL